MVIAQIQVTSLTTKVFKQFLLRGNVVDLAVGVVIGAAFGSVVNSLVKGLLTPFIAAVTKQPDSSSSSFLETSLPLWCR